MRPQHITISIFVVITLYLLPSHKLFAGVCVSDQSDTDGDGYGWEDGKSCTVIKECQSHGSDIDGDGWGWEQGRSCVVISSSVPVSSSSALCVDTDGDGWGFDGRSSCQVDRPCIDTPPAGDGWGWDGYRPCEISTPRHFNPHSLRITDVVLITGQSNALGSNTSVNRELDSPSTNVFAWTSNGWQVADLRQIWDLGWHPRTTPDGKHPHNNFGLHFGKQIGFDSDKVVGFILVSAPGKSISSWDADKPLFSKIKSQVDSSLANLPHINTVSAILWHQGENDWFGGPEYQTRLTDLIGNFRQQPWLDQSALFIAGETAMAPVNADLEQLNADGDYRTACISSAGLTVQDDHVHFDAQGLRELGHRYAHKYLELMIVGTAQE